MALAGPRATRVLRWAGALKSSTLLASRGFSASVLRSSDAGDGLAASSAAAGWGEGAATGGDLLATSGDGLAAAADLGADATLAAAAAAEGVAAAGEAAGAASSEIGSVMSAAMAAVDGLHAATGLPWWATIASVGVLVRAAMFPVSLQGMKASAALMPLLRQAREELAAAMRPPLPAVAPPPPAADDKREGPKQQRWQRAQQQSAAAAAAHAHPQQQEQQQQQQPPQPSTAAVLHRFTQLRLAAGAPHPIWVLASPLAQLPVFITAMATVRTMSLTGWPGFSEGGVAWFRDLTLPALDLANLVAPLGSAGAVLPVVITVSMLANIDAAFAVPAGSRQQASVMLYLMGGLRLFMEWIMVPLFAIAMQLPQGALCYWATSSFLALAQNHALKQPAVRRLVGLPTGEPQQQQAAAGAPPPATAEAAAAAAAAVAAGAAGPLPAGVDPELRSFLLTTSDQGALFEKAAALRAEGRASATSAVLQRLLQLYPGQPNALFGLGQVHAALKDWQLSEQYYLQAAQSPQLDPQSRAKCWFGAAVAMHMQREDEAAIDAFRKAAQGAQTDELRVRSWVSQATLLRKAGQLDKAVGLLRKAAKAEPKVEEAYLKPLLAEMAGGPRMEEAQQLLQQQASGAGAEAAGAAAEQQQQQQQQQQAAQAEGDAEAPQAAARRQGEK
ncbi:hypothetical protein ABPG75_005309 [Micractinium tetrahymenae]